ncbi:MAG: hypothetical protein ABIG61_11755 [Planctomycetota bacterium]
MKKQPVVISALLACLFAFCEPCTAKKIRTDMTEAMRESLVYLEISAHGYEQHQPWKHTDVTRRPGYGCAVGKYEVLTTARNVVNAAFIKVQKYAQNEFIPAKVKVADYQSDLALLELDANSMLQPLKPLKFSDDYRKGVDVDFYWLSADGDLYTGRGFLDRARVSQSTVSYAQMLNYVVANTSQQTGLGQVYCDQRKPVGIACWANENKESWVIPAETINRFLADAGDSLYKGFGVAGFGTTILVDPAMRSYLKMPGDLKNGVYVTEVYNLGTGSKEIRKADVILAIDGRTIDSYGQFEHPAYGRLSFQHLIASRPVGEQIIFDVWRDGSRQRLDIEVRNFGASEMLVPYYEYSEQPEYVITAGFILQKLTREYLAAWGENWPGRVAPHVYHYYRDLAFRPTEERQDIVILSYVLPAAINLAYKDLGQLVVKKFNGMEIRSIRDVVEAQKLNPQSKYDVIEFEMDNPVVVIPRDALAEADSRIAQAYGITKPVNVR